MSGRRPHGTAPFCIPPLSGVFLAANPNREGFARDELGGRDQQSHGKNERRVTACWRVRWRVSFPSSKSEKR